MTTEDPLLSGEAFLSGRITIQEFRDGQYGTEHRLAAALALMASFPGQYCNDQGIQAVTTEERLFETLRLLYPSDPQAYEVLRSGFDSRVFMRLGGKDEVVIFWPSELRDILPFYTEWVSGGAAKWSEYLVAERAQQLMAIFRGETPAVQAEFKRLLDLG